jgi:Rod binding domain-containing protein
MDSIDRTGSSAAPLTADQEAALKKLHVAATQLEGVFVNMLFKEMRQAAPKVTMFGKVSESEKTFNEMLDQARADKLAQSGSLGMAKIIESQLRDGVLASLPGAVPAVPPKKAAGAYAPAQPPPDESKP